MRGAELICVSSHLSDWWGTHGKVSPEKKAQSLIAADIRDNEEEEGQALSLVNLSASAAGREQWAQSPRSGRAMSSIPARGLLLCPCYPQVGDNLGIKS